MYIIMSYVLTLLCYSVGRPSVVSILETLEYHLDRIRSGSSLLDGYNFVYIDCVWGSQTGDVYSTISLTILL